jgi:hypothetical protein
MEKLKSLQMVADTFATDLWDGYDGQHDLVAAKLEELGWTFNPDHLTVDAYTDRLLAAQRVRLQEVHKLFTCPQCDEPAKWTDGRSLRAGDEVNEFWCTRCGAETPLSDTEAARLPEWRPTG